MTDFTFTPYRETSFVTAPETLHERIDELLNLGANSIKIEPLLTVDFDNPEEDDVLSEYWIHATFDIEQEATTL